MKSSTKRCTEAAPSSRMRRRMASITPAITRNDAHTSPWKTANAASEPVWNGGGREAEDDDAVGLELAEHRLEVEPAEDEREGDRHGEDAPPHDEHVGQPAQRVAPEDEPVGQHLAAEAVQPRPQRCAAGSRAGRRRPSRAASRAWSAGARATCCSGRSARRWRRGREGVGHQRRVEVGQVPRSDQDEDGQQHRGDQPPDDRLPDFRDHAEWET
jgi:hypothetical protein